MAVATSDRLNEKYRAEALFLVEDQALRSGGSTNISLEGGGKIGLFKAVIGGTIGLVAGVATCQPITGMVGGAFVAQDWGK